MALPCVTVLAAPARADAPTVEFVTQFRGQSPAWTKHSSEDTGGIAQLDRARPERGIHKPTQILPVTSPVGIGSGRRYNNAYPTSTGRGVVKSKRSLRDSACVLTPPSFLQPKAARPLPPSLSTTTPDNLGQMYTSNGTTNQSAISASDGIRGDLPGSAIPTVVLVPIITAETNAHCVKTENTSNPYSTYPRGLSREEFLTAYAESARIKLQATIDSGVFNWPPRNLAAEHAAYRRVFPEDPRATAGSLINISVTQALVKKHSALWKPFDAHVEEERRQLSSLKKDASDKFATKQDIEQAIIKMRMGIRRQVGKGHTIDTAHPCLKVLFDTQKRLDEEIASNHATWREKVRNLYKFIEEGFRLEYHENEVEEELKAVKRVEEAKETEFHRVTRLTGWGHIPYPEPNQGARQFQVSTDAVTIPAWFEAVDLAAIVQISAEEPKQRFNKFLNIIHDLEEQMRADAERRTNPPPQPKQLRKAWHESNPGWPYSSWRKSGGWWVCRTGPGASKAEEKCQVCFSKRDTRGCGHQESQQTPTATETYKRILAEIQKAMSQELIEDKKEVKARLERERRAARRKESLYRNGWDGGYLSTPRRA